MVEEVFDVLSLSGLVMDLNDGQKSIEAQSKDQREHSFKEPPSLLEVRGRKEGKAGGEGEGGGEGWR